MNDLSHTLHWLFSVIIDSYRLLSVTIDSYSVRRLATGWEVRGSNPGGDEIFRICRYGPWGPPSLLYNGYQASFKGVKRVGRGVDHPPPSPAEIKKRVERYNNFLPPAFMAYYGVNFTFTLHWSVAQQVNTTANCHITVTWLICIHWYVFTHA